MIVLLLVLLFIICWILGLITWIRIMILIKNIKNDLAEKAPTLTYSLGLEIKTNAVSQIKTSGIKLLKMYFSFGSIQNTRNFVNCFADLQEIEGLGDIHLQIRIEKLIKLFSLFSKIWIIGFISILFGFLYSQSNY